MSLRKMIAFSKIVILFFSLSNFQFFLEAVKKIYIFLIFYFF